MSGLEVGVMLEAGREVALFGLSLSHGLHLQDLSDSERSDRKRVRACKLAHLGGGHNKFMESMIVWLNVRAPRYWWQQADTYRIATKQSESTMHTILKRPLAQSDFMTPIPEAWLQELNRLIETNDLDQVKRLLPESFMQRRVWCLSYKTLQNIYQQRRLHKLSEWRVFLDLVLMQISHPEYIKPPGEAGLAEEGEERHGG